MSLVSLTHVRTSRTSADCLVVRTVPCASKPLVNSGLRVAGRTGFIRPVFGRRNTCACVLAADSYSRTIGNYSYRMVVQYDGTAYRGWQIQQSGFPSIQVRQGHGKRQG
eukprot:364730-Chlamydomonas_euryale.AAC.6